MVDLKIFRDSHVVAGITAEAEADVEDADEMRHRYSMLSGATAEAGRTSASSS